jgi:CheY-like chemotaxis protein
MPASSGCDVPRPPRAEEAAVEEFVSRLCHELGAPVATILLWEQILRESNGDPDVQNQALDAIRESAEHHGRLLAELRTYGRLRSQRDEVVRSSDLPFPESGQLRGIKVLVLDDDPHLLDALRMLLGRAGADVHCQTSAAAAFEQLEREAFHVLLTDLTMPEEDGLRLIRRIRIQELDVAVIALSALSSDEDRDRSLASGFDLHLTKPVSLERLAASILFVLAQRPHRNLR